MKDKRMMKVAIIITYIVNNGPSRVVMNLINSLDRLLYTPVLVTLISNRNDGKIIDQIKKQIDVIELDMNNHKDCLIRSKPLFKNVLKKAGVSIIHSHGLIPDIVTALYGSDFGRVSTIHNNLWEDYTTEYGWKGKHIWAPLHLYILKKMDHCVCCSSSVYDALNTSIPRCSYVRNGISSQHANIEIDEKENLQIQKLVSHIPGNAFVFLFAGRMIDRKKPEWLVREFVSSHTDEEYLIMAGDGPQLEACKGIGDGHVIFTGFIKNIQRLYEITNVYVSASVSEGLSISVIEAMEQGNALLLSDIPSHREILGISDDCYLGELFRETDFKTHLDTLRMNKDLLDRHKIRSIQVKHLSSMAMAKGYEDIYSKLSGHARKTTVRG